MNEHDNIALDAELLNCIRVANDCIDKRDRSALNSLCTETSFLAAFKKAEWIVGILGITRDWPEAIRPSVQEVRSCCDFHAKTLEKAALNDGPPQAINAKTLTSTYSDYRDPVIEGLLRKGETMNIIAGPKVGKSWLVLSLALSLSNGNPWLGLDTMQSNVLLVDNELHVETMAQRLRSVAMAQCESLTRLSVLPLRGRAEDIMSCRSLIVDEANKNQCGLIILDALYRFLPAGTSENDNAAMTALYNQIDGIARETGCSIILIHHSSKGNQGEKSVTDGGAGAGAVSRAADAHVFLREHEEEGHVVFDCVARSWPPMDAFVIKGTFQEGAKIWQKAPGMDPSLVRGRKTDKTAPRHSVVTVEQLQKSYLIPRHESPLEVVINDAALTLDATKTAVKTAFLQAVNEGKAIQSVVHRQKMIRSA